MGQCESATHPGTGVGVASRYSCSEGVVCRLAPLARHKELLGSGAGLRMEAAELLPDEPTQLVLGHVLLLERKAEGLAVGLVVDVMQRGQVLMLQRLRRGDALARIEDEHLIEQVDGLSRGVRVQPLEGDALPLGQRLDVLYRLRVADHGEVRGRRRAQGVDDQAQLLQVVAAWEEGLAA